jgi:transcription elongation factor Elf1
VFERLLRGILGILGRWTGDAGSNEAIGKVRLSEEFPALLLADAVRGGGALHERARAYGVDGDVFALGVRYALRPFLGAYARELRREGRFDPESLGAGLPPRERSDQVTCPETEAPGSGRCPVCGAEPFIAEFDEEDGRKRLSCGLCGTRWRFPRLKCPFCGNEDQAKLGYLEVEGLEGYRAYVCDVCRGYVKAVDRRVISPAPSPELADAVTPELDEAALERGYCTRRTSCDATGAHRTRP